MKGYIYILTNPSFPDYVKIGYADDVEARLRSLNRSECIPFAFRLYATYEVNNRLTDLKVHNMIDQINPDLRSVETIKGKTRVREFYAMDAQTAYQIFEAMAQIHGTEKKLKLIKPSKEEVEHERVAKEVEEESKARARKFKFSFCNIKPGEYVDFVNPADPDITVRCKVLDDRHVEYQGEAFSLSTLAKLLTGKKLTPAGPLFFKYKGEWLNDIRHRNGY